MGINIGKLNKRITILSYQESEDEMGQSTQELKPYKRVWATIKPLRGREYWEAKKVQEEVVYKITTRYIKGITSDMLIQYKEKIFEINSVINVEESDLILEMQCTEKVKHG
ncbi:phage head closure protein [Velocimicrobium porci]|uniref:Phage head closure protein n=1 Tax=Velocimicrobium porci TaxID=2606634 RepID=A0A6L5XXA4_9FIRM|nr:phage head closure protein [Velocimicrobium porci]MSS63177.1 phage head closure protein [Velocimicrobium porci]